MTEEERLAIAKERIEFILKTYDVVLGYDEFYDTNVLYVKNNFSKRIELKDNV